MNHLRALVLFASIGAFPACTGGDGSVVAQNADGTLRVAHAADARWKQELAHQEMEAALEHLPRIDLVYAHNDPMAAGAAQACKAKGRTGIKFVGVDGLRGEGQKYVADGLLDATLEYPTGAAAAIDMALLACSGIAPPRRIVLGTRIYTKATLAKGGTLVP